MLLRVGKADINVSDSDYAVPSVRIANDEHTQFLVSSKDVDSMEEAGSRRNNIPLCQV